MVTSGFILTVSRCRWDHRCRDYGCWKWSRHPDAPALQRGFKNVNAERPGCLPGIYRGFVTNATESRGKRDTARAEKRGRAREG
jgi:hypothetical protein